MLDRRPDAPALRPFREVVSAVRLTLRPSMMTQSLHRGPDRCRRSRGLWPRAARWLKNSVPTLGMPVTASHRPLAGGLELDRLDCGILSEGILVEI